VFVDWLFCHQRTTINEQPSTKFMRKVLIITYYWPPAGSSGVQRWLKFVKYLREFGWEPVVYTAENPEVASIDESLLKDVPSGVEIIRKHVPEPYKVYKLIAGKKGQKIGVGFTSEGSKKNGIINKVAIWVRGNFFIPDARMFWIRPSVKFLTKYIKENPVDLIVSSGPPHSLHLIALGVKRKCNVPWIADFRDPWTNIDFYKDLNPTWIADRIHKRLEKKVLQRSDLIVTISQSMAEEFRNKTSQRVEVITNGYDHSDFKEETVVCDSDFSIVHIGSIPPSRNCVSLWRAISKLSNQDLEFKERLKLRFVGSVDYNLIESLKEANLYEQSTFDGTIPHGKAISIQRSAQVLLLLVNDSPNANGILTGKVFEYFAAKRPILALGPVGGELDDLLSKTKAGILLPFHSEPEIFEGLKWLWEEYKNEWKNFKTTGTEPFSRKELTKVMANLMDELISK